MKKVKNWPKISFILLTLNGGEGVIKALESIKMQDYPLKKIDIVVIDDGSKDKSVEYARRYTNKVFRRPGNGLYKNWIFGLHEVTGEFVYYIEQDIELRGKNWIKQMIVPLIENKQLAASFTREGYPKKEQSWVAQFLSYHPLQCDPLYEFLTPPLSKSFIKKKKEYILCQFKLGELAPVGRFFYRVAFLKKTNNWKVKAYYDHDFLIVMVKSGFNLYAYVPQAGIFHSHARNLKHLLQKRMRNVDIHYFPYNNETEYRWLDTGDKIAVIKLCFFIVYANLFFPELIRGAYRSIKNKALVLLIQPVITLSVTDVLIWKFMHSQVGRKIILNSLTTLISNTKKSVKAFG